MQIACFGQGLHSPRISGGEVHDSVQTFLPGEGQLSHVLPEAGDTFNVRRIAGFAGMTKCRMHKDRADEKRVFFTR